MINNRSMLCSLFLTLSAITSLVGCGSGGEKPIAAPSTPTPATPIVAKPKQEPEVKWVDPKTIQPSPVRHESLTGEQNARIKRLYDVFHEVDPTPLESWTDDFKRDLDPNREIEIWENMASAYERYLTGKNLSLEIRKEVFRIVLMRSSAAEQDVLKHVKLKYLTEKDAREVMAGFEASPKPLLIYKK